MFDYIRIGFLLERAAKCASERKNEELTANFLAKAERLVHKSRLNIHEANAIITLYDRVIIAAANPQGTIPIKEHCEEMKGFLR